MAGTSADTITILSIDGGGVRGIIPGVILDFLESKLKEYGGENTRLADYFDVISGTSTGGLIAAMISTPNHQKRPLYDANQIVPFYKRECPKIFKKKSCILCHSSYENCHSEDCHEMYLKMLTDAAASHGNENNKKVLLGSTYDGGYIQKLASDILGDKRLSNTLTNLVIPAYDIKKLSPVVFSSYEVDNGNEELDALLSDICISTSAAPTYLPAYQFFNKNTEFNMIDGGVAANNPTAAAITEVVKKRAKVHLEKGKRKGKGKRKRGEEEESDLINSSRLLVLSLGTGADKSVGKYNAKMVNSWSAINWIQNPPWNFWSADRPIIDFMSDANADMIDHYSTMFFDSSLHPENFLRIQDSKLPEELAAMDNADPANLDKLEQYAKDLLNKPVTSLNLATFQRIIVNENDTYQVALGKFAKKLIAIKKNRAKKSREISRLTRLRSGAVLK
ncbi:patatin-like protein 3 [Humulus lupulus]|uniref:patatin-like protein 3 n=1 Tax=Humulus lupulus TaxID=3486 RepID=UPI002B412633|nr:patatin-like protein 3 [Humulus lupulus]